MLSFDRSAGLMNANRACYASAEHMLSFNPLTRDLTGMKRQLIQSSVSLSRCQRSNGFDRAFASVPATLDLTCASFATSQNATHEPLKGIQ